MITIKERAKTCYFDPTKEQMSKPPPGNYETSDRIL